MSSIGYEDFCVTSVNPIFDGFEIFPEVLDTRSLHFGVIAVCSMSIEKHILVYL